MKAMMNLKLATALASALAALSSNGAAAEPADGAADQKDLVLTESTILKPAAGDASPNGPTAYEASGEQSLKGQSSGVDLTITGGWFQGFKAEAAAAWDISNLNDLTVEISNPKKQDDSVGLYALNGGRISVHGVENLKVASLQPEVISGKTDAIPIHAQSGTISITDVGSVSVEAPKAGNAIMVQANATQNGSVAIKASGDITVSAKSNTIVVGMVANTEATSQAKLELQGQNISIKSASQTALQAYDLDKNYKGPNQGSTSVVLTASESITIDGGAYGFLQSRKNANATSEDYGSEALLKAPSVSIRGGVSALVTQQAAQNQTANAVTIDAATVELASEGKGYTVNDQTSYRATLDVAEQSSITIQNSSGTGANVTISAAKGNAVSIAENAQVSFDDASVSVEKGNVVGNGAMNLARSRMSLASGVTMNMHQVSGEDAEIVFNTAEKGAVTIADADKNVTVLASGDLNDRYGAAALDFIDADEAATGAEAGKVNGAIVELADGTHAVQENAAMRAIEQMNASTLVQFRLENNRLSQRLGEVRDNLQTAGAWARVYGAKSRLSDSIGTDVTTNSVQVGADAAVGGNWIVGGAFSYTNMDADFDNGSGESDSYMLAAYASGFFDCGGYVDVIGRFGRLSTDLAASSGRTVAPFSGSYDNTALGLSAEVGYHWKLSELFFAEPQMELAYGYVLGDDYQSSNGVKVEQDDFQSLVGRIGARFGADFPKDAGSIYLHASINRDFLGDNDFTAKAPGMTSAVKFSNDLDETWVSYGIGLQFNASKNFYVYGSLERSSGSEYDESYHYSVGGRYVF